MQEGRRTVRRVRRRLRLRRHRWASLKVGASIARASARNSFPAVSLARPSVLATRAERDWSGTKLAKDLET